MNKTKEPTNLELALKGQLNPDKLTAEEDNMFFQEFFESMKKDSGKAVSSSVFSDNEGNSVGIDENGDFWGYDKKGKFDILPL